MNSFSLQISPNPANESVMLQFGKTDEIESWSLKLVDITGRIRLNKKLQNEVGTTKHYLDTAHLQEGVYFVIIEGKKDILIRKLFIGD